MRPLLLLCLALLAPLAALAQPIPFPPGGGLPAIALPRAAEPPPAPVTASPNPVPAGTPAIAPAAQGAATTAAPAAPTAEATPAPAQRRRRTARRAPSRSQDPRDRAYMDGGTPSGSGFGGFDATVTAPPRPELAPRPNLDMEGPRAALPSNNPTLEPTLINPRLPGRSQVQDSGVTQRENRLLQSPAPGARLSVPMSW